MTRSPLALTCGDPSGVGPDICVAAWHHLRQDHPIVYFGDRDHVPAGITTQVWTPGDAVSPDTLSVHPISFAGPRRLGVADLANAHGTQAAITQAVACAQSGAISAITTAPIHKKVLQDGAGFSFPGHTEFLGHLAGVDRVVMMLASPDLRVVPTTIHIPLAVVVSQLTAELIQDTIRITAQSLERDFGIPSPRIVVAGVDPHAGEGGNIGTVDRDVIAPALAPLQAQGLNIIGPVSADTLFHARARATYDVAICMYHDQALIPIKTIDFDRGVNVTLGLPFIRTSPDHGTAFDIAGTDAVNPTSMIEAVSLAAKMANARGH
ncbi:MAG: 4-hydroxythreonine-4-phosphate dehydrogenase PdxA [Pseudomonadota bacterium]